VLPRNTATLSVTASDPDLDALTFRWSVTNQPLRHWWAVKRIPAGAQPQFDYWSATNTTVGNLNLPGNYTFTLRASVIVDTPFIYTITAGGRPGGFGDFHYAFKSLWLTNQGSGIIACKIVGASLFAATNRLSR
jgi:hypothetical protein